MLVALSCSACAQLIPGAEGPKTGARANGEPLLVVDDVKTWVTTQHDHVGEVRVENDAGERLARADVYEDRQHHHVKYVWFPAQGDQVLADEDFFRIAGDQESLDATLRWRERNRAWNHGGKITMVAGAATVLVAIALGRSTTSGLVLLGGTLGIVGGWYITRWSHAEQEPENHAVDRSTAVEAAQRYNQSHGIAVSRSF